MKKVIVAYVPVIHRGYGKFFEHHIDVETIYVLGESLIEEFDPLKKDIRALNPKDVRRLLEGWYFSQDIEIANHLTLWKLQLDQAYVIMPDEDISRLVAETYLYDCNIEFDSVFLRWDRQRTVSQEMVYADRIVPFDGFIAEAMNRALSEAKRSSDWWRQVGAVIARDGIILLHGYNRHLPSPHAPYTSGDPRGNFSRGVNIELSTAQHAEAALIAWAAREGIPLAGSDLFVTTFPCPVCAKLIADSGIKHLYFLEGYAMLDGERVLRENSVEIIRVDMKTPTP